MNFTDKKKKLNTYLTHAFTERGKGLAYPSDNVKTSIENELEIITGQRTDTDNVYPEEPKKYNEIFVYYYIDERGVYQYKQGKIDHQLLQLQNNYVVDNDDKRIKAFFLSDAVQVRGDNLSINGFNIHDYFGEEYYKKATNREDQYAFFSYRGLHHRDAFQIIKMPTPLDYDDQRDRYAASETTDITFDNNIIYSEGSLQGIFSSDGIHKKITCTNNTITTSSAHKISINGLLTGYFENNKNNKNEFIQILLEPLRMGGGIWSNIYILGMVKNDGNVSPEYNYGKLSQGSKYISEKVTYKEQGSFTKIIDNRMKLPKNNSIGISNFPIDQFKFDYTNKTIKTLYSELDNRNGIERNSNFKVVLNEIIKVYNEHPKVVTKRNLQYFNDLKLPELSQKESIYGEVLRWACIKELSLKYTQLEEFNFCITV